MGKFKKLIIVWMCLTLLVSSNCICANAQTDENIQPYFIVTQNTSETFSINSSGVASMTAALSPKDASKVDTVKVTFKIKNSNGVSVYNKTYTASWSSLFGEYNLYKTYQLSGRDAYMFNVVYKCYKNNTLIETITTDYIVDSY